MAAVSHNHTNYQARLDYIQQLLVDHLGLSSKVGKQAGKQASRNHYHSHIISARRGPKIEWSRRLNIRTRLAPHQFSVGNS